jgi:hypothetical protein
MKLRSILLVLFLSIASAQGLLAPVSIPDISGTGSAVAIAASGTVVRFCQLVSPSTNTNNVRWGDSAITTSRGSIIAPGGGQFIPPGGVGSPYTIDLGHWYVLVQSGDHLTETCAK